MRSPDKKQLEIKLSRLELFNNPKSHLEQYATDPALASYVANVAYLRGDIEGRSVIDLGAGTGVFSFSALYFGCSDLTAVEMDPDQKQILESNLSQFENKTIVMDDVRNVSGKWDTVLCNGPFGSVEKDADLPFLHKAFTLGKSIYLIHNWKAKDFVVKYASERSNKISFQRKALTIPRMYDHHEKERMKIDVLFLVCEV